MLRLRYPSHRRCNCHGQMARGYSHWGQCGRYSRSRSTCLIYQSRVGDRFAGRDISAKQLVENFISVFGSTTGSANDLEETKGWRLEWWKVIFDYTFNGPYFWTGKGFGINLADADGFLVAADPTAPFAESAQLPRRHPCSNWCSWLRALVAYPG